MSLLHIASIVFAIGLCLFGFFIATDRHSGVNDDAPGCGGAMFLLGVFLLLAVNGVIR